MDEKKYRLPGRTSLSLPVDDVDRLLRLADGDSALLYLHILRTGGSLIPSLAARALSRTEEEILRGIREAKDISAYDNLADACDECGQ